MHRDTEQQHNKEPAAAPTNAGNLFADEDAADVGFVDGDEQQHTVAPTTNGSPR